MKKIYLLFMTIIGSSMMSLAQPILTQSNFVPAINDLQLYYIADTNTVLDNTTGANVIFNYTQMRGDTPTVASQTQYFVNPSITPNSGDFPTATFADTTGGSPENMKYNQDFTDSLDIIGLVLNINTFGKVIAKYDNDPETVMKFPFQYGDSFTDNYGGVFTSPIVPLPTNGNGSVTVTADAWGTLKLPYALDIDSVLRVVRIENLLTDTIFLQPTFPNILPIPITATQISYYKPSISKNPLLSYITANVNGDTSVSVVSQYPMNGVGVNELEDKINVALFPNPSKDFTTISFGLKNNAFVKVSLTNSLSQNVKEVFNGNLSQGKNELKIKTSHLSKGLYVVNINIDNRSTTRKLVIE